MGWRRMTRADEANRPGGLYQPAVTSHGALLHLAGQTARRGERVIAKGVVGDTVGLPVARDCARQCADNLFAHARDHLGGADRIRRLVRLNVFIAATQDFEDHARVADAASARMAELLGDRGAHVCSAIGVASLPRGSPVEIDAVFEVEAGVDPD